MFWFRDSVLLWFLAVVPVIGLWYWWRDTRLRPTLRFSDTTVFPESVPTTSAVKSHALMALRLTAVASLVLGLSRPQSGSVESERMTEGIDIMLVLDISSSMQALDFKPNRLEAAKAVAREFVLGRADDRIGLVVFAGESFVQSPLTVDHEVLVEFLDRVRIVEGKYDGTAMGMAIVNAINRLRDSDAKSKVMIFLSDGRNNAGEMDPITAANLAKTLGIRVYTIGAGTTGPALYPVQDKLLGRTLRTKQLEIDEDNLREIANVTGARYFRATDEESLARIYDEIGALEKSEIRVLEHVRYRELYAMLLIPAFAFLILESVLGQTLLRRIP